MEFNNLNILMMTSKKIAERAVMLMKERSGDIMYFIDADHVHFHFANWNIIVTRKISDLRKFKTVKAVVYHIEKELLKEFSSKMK